MRVLRRFPVSDEFNSDRKTFCVILDWNEIFEISYFSEPGKIQEIFKKRTLHVTVQS